MDSTNPQAAHEQHDIMDLEQAWERQGLKRRDFMRLLLAGASTATIAGILAACGGGGSATNTTAPAAATTGAAPAATTTRAATTAAPAATGTRAATATATRTGSPTATRSAAAPGGAGAGAASGYPSGGKFSTLEPVGRRGGGVIEGTFADLQTFNPMLSSDTSSAAVIAMMFNSLVSVNPDNAQPFPVLATEVPTRENGGISADGLTYTFKLRNDVKWSDGTPFTAKDVVYTYETMKKPELGSPRTAELNDRVESITAQGDNTAVFILKKVVAPFLTSNMYNIVPQHILGNVPVPQIKGHAFSTGSAQTIGTGPFKFQEYVKADHITLVKNPTHFLGDPALDRFIYKVVKDATVVTAQLKTNELDYGGIQPAFLEDMSKQQNVNIARYDTFGFTFYAYNLDPAKTTLFQDVKVRQALAYALDREALVRAILLGVGQVAEGTMPTLSWAYAPDQIRTKYPFNAQRANQLLDEAGWVRGADGIRAKDGKRLSFTIWTNAGNRVREQYVTVMQQQWKNVGVEAAPKTEEWNAFLTRIRETHDFEIQLVGFSWGTDPDQTTMWATDSYTGGFNLGRYSNQRVDQLLAQGLSELDQEKRKQLYVEMQNIIMDEIPSFIIDFPQALAVVNKRVHNLKPNAINVRWNAHTWWVADGR